MWSENWFWIVVASDKTFEKKRRLPHERHHLKNDVMVSVDGSNPRCSPISLVLWQCDPTPRLPPPAPSLLRRINKNNNNSSGMFLANKVSEPAPRLCSMYSQASNKPCNWQGLNTITKSTILTNVYFCHAFCLTFNFSVLNQSLVVATEVRDSLRLAIEHLVFQYE